MRRLAWLIGGLALLTAGCADTRGPGAPRSEARAPGDGVGHYKVGRPYQINGRWYYPAVDYDYRETGLASWYGPGFHGRMTANGEIFDMNDVSAAHTTLPLPSVVRVTNLENGRSAIVRVNDRGPFVDGRILDVSRRTAQLLGFERDGLAQVRIELLPDASKREMLIAQGVLPREPGAPATAVAQAAPATAVAAATPREPEPPARPVAVAATPLEPPPVAAAPLPSPTRLAAAVTEPAPAPVPRPAHTVVAAALPETTPSRAADLPGSSPSRFALVSRAAAATAPPALRPNPAPAATGPAAGGAIFVQTGTFRSAQAAERVRARLAGFGPAQLVSAGSGAEATYRVKVGPLPSSAQAERVMEAAMTIAQEEARVAAR